MMTSTPPEHADQLGRRALLRAGSLLLGAAALDRAWANAQSAPAPGRDALRIALMTDLHYADREPAGSRHYRETLDKLADAARHVKERKPDFIVELGDFIDAAESVAAEKEYLARINRVFASICPRRHYVLGNHCVFTLTKAEFLAGIERERSFYSFDVDSFHFVVLDACFREDGEPYGRKNFHWSDANIPASQLEWLERDLAAARKPTIVFAHQRLDIAGQHAVKNALAVRRVLEQAGRVLAVFQGHSHRNDYQDVNGIHYCTLVAMVEGSGQENSGCAMLYLARGGAIRVDGFRRQASYAWAPRRG